MGEEKLVALIQESLSVATRTGAAIRSYIRNQEKEDQRLDQLNLWRSPRRLWAAPSSSGRVSDPSCRFERLKS
jgi:hypothetical protein